MQAWPLCARVHQQTPATPKLTTILHVQANKFFLSFTTLENCNMASITLNSHTWYISQLLVQCALSFRPNILVYISGNFQGESPGKRSTSRVIPNCFKKISDRGLPFHLILLLGILSSMIQQSFWKLSNEISVPFTPVSEVQGFFRRMERAQCDRSVLQPLALSFKRLTKGWRSSSVQCKNLQKRKC